MSNLNVNPTRMELRKIKGKLKTAENGHKLIKDKTNELIRRFYECVKEYKNLRIEVEQKLNEVFSLFLESKNNLSENEINLLLSFPNTPVYVSCFEKEFLNFQIPEIEINEEKLSKALPYSPLSSTSVLDFSLDKFYEILPQIFKLAELQKKSILMSNEIEKCKRRVNALENILIPNYQKTIKEIELKLSESERSTNTNMIKLKNIISK